jgi:hypothetical protein
MRRLKRDDVLRFLGIYTFPSREEKLPSFFVVAFEFFEVNFLD